MGNPELESLGQLVVDFKIVLATIGTGAKLYTLLSFPWITPVTWRGGPAAWATACFPYHPCPGLHPGETFQGSDPWPLMTEGCHTDCLVSENFLIFNCRADYF